MTAIAHHATLIAAAGNVPAGPHAYWRLNATLAGASFTEVGELQFRATVGGASLCAGGSPVFSAQAGTGTADGAAGNAFDGTPNTRWYCSGLGWIGYHLPSSSVVHEVMLQSPNFTGGGYVNTPRQFTIDWSDDGIAWTTAGTYTTPTWTAASQIRTFAVS